VSCKEHVINVCLICFESGNTEILQNIIFMFHLFMIKYEYADEEIRCNRCLRILLEMIIYISFRGQEGWSKMLH
jgi:hypothetical protein